jgi:uncharacterized protein Yka (UPF0111/DUF47 family)
MATHAEMAAQLLREAADFFSHLAKDNPEVSKEMLENAAIYEQVANLIEKDPTGEVDMGEAAGEA